MEHNLHGVAALLVYYGYLYVAQQTEEYEHSGEVQALGTEVLHYLW